MTYIVWFFVIVIQIFKFLFSLLGKIWDFITDIHLFSRIFDFISGCISFIGRFFSGCFSFIKKFLRFITYKRTIFDSIWVYLLIILVVMLIAYMLMSLFEKEKSRIYASIALVAVFMIATYCNKFETAMIVLLVEMIIGIIMMVFYNYDTKSKIGGGKDVSEGFALLASRNYQMGAAGLVVALNIVSKVNGFFKTSIPIYIPIIVFNAILLISQFKEYTDIMKGYKFISEYTRKNSFFHYNDYSKKSEFNYLKHKQEYVALVTDKLVTKNKIHKMTFGNQYFINNNFKRKLEKNIKSNLSSDKIEAVIDVDFRDFGFENVYKTVFAMVKGYDIDFTESAETKKRKRSQSGIGASEFIVMRYPIENHPILSEDNEIRVEYVTALNELVCNGKIDNAKWNAKVEEYSKVFGVETLSNDANSCIERFANVIKKKGGLFKTIKVDYSYVILLESIYFRNLLSENDLSYKEIENVFDRLKISKGYRDFIYQYIKAMFIEGNIQAAEQHLQSSLQNDVIKTLEYIHYNIMWNERYVVLPQYNVAVCATMSAGKSTFINAMLGTDYIPSKNEACTAKVTTIRDNDNINRIIGCYTRTDNSKVYSNIIDADILSKWNEDVQVTETVLEGDLEEISCENGVLVMHDTPGTNNSGDDSHHDRTIEFLTNNDLNLIIYLINAEYISTNDTEILLKEIQEITKNKEAQIVFGLNKIDCFDEEGDESLGGAMNGLHAQLKTYGFEKPIIFPFSANAARLFKLAIKGKELTKREQRVFGNLMERFTTFDASKYVMGIKSEIIKDIYPQIDRNKKIVVKDEEYSCNDIINALNHTGILNIENWMAQEMKKR